VRASDGGNLRRLPIATPREGFDQEFDVVGGGSTILVKEIEPRSDGPDHSILYSFDRRLHTLRRLTQTASAMSVVNLEFFPSAVEDVSPDGSQVAFCEFVTADYETSMFLERPDGSGLRRLVGPDVGAISARWSPDGKQIAFTGEKDRDNQIWVVRPDGSGLRQLTDGAGGALSIIPVWSPDGSRLLFQRKQGATLTLWTMNADGSDQRQLSPTPISLGADGQKDWTGPYAWWAPPTA
jgi:dipeptidyl aminopeptidase/acylaminoacyl peptidase